MKNNLCAIGAAVVLAALVGCGGEEARSDFPQESPEIAYAKSVKSDIEMLKEQVGEADVGAGGLRDVLEGYVENFEFLEEEPLGEHQETYFQIRDGINELYAMTEISTTSGSEIMRKIAELEALAAKLPGDAETPPAE